MTLAFAMYDWFVRRRNNKVMGAAVRSTAIVSSLFPSNVRDRLYKEAEENAAKKQRMENWMHTEGADAIALEADNDVIAYKGKPIADLFPETTILFADIAGFTGKSISRLLPMRFEMSVLCSNSLLTNIQQHGHRLESLIKSSNYWKLCIRHLIILQRDVVCSK
jgi:hypothetical protein